ncbi:ADP-ribosylation factor-like protein 6-interacting protein 4 isoform 2-T2 [Megaptera novaeangliae]
MLRARRKDSDERGHSCGKGPAGSGTGARLESRSLVWELRLEPQLASPGGQCVRLSFLGCPRDGTWGFRTKGSSALLRGRTASQSTVPGRKSPSRRFLTRRRGAGLAARPDGRLRRERSSRGDFLSGGEAAEGAGWSGSSSSSSSSSSSDGRKKRGKHKDKKRKKRKKRKKKLKKRDKDKAKVQQTEAVPGPSLDQWHRAAEQEEGGPVLTDEQKSRIQAMKPMTKEEWDARQSVIRKVVDPETGRTRLIKGDGEVLEEIVTKERHREINKQATRGDGLAFQMRAGLLP